MVAGDVLANLGSDVSENTSKRRQASAQRKPPLPAFGSPRLPETGACQGDPLTLAAGATATHLRRSACEEIIVREADFRRYGTDLEKLRKCQVPKWKDTPQTRRLSQKELFEQACRSQSEVCCPWRDLENPELSRATAENDRTVNQVWVQPATQLPVREDAKNDRSQSEDAFSRMRVDRQVEARRCELVEWVQKIDARSNSVGTRSTSARSCRSVDSLSDVPSSNRSTSLERSVSTSVPQRDRLRRDSREPARSGSQKRRDRPPRPNEEVASLQLVRSRLEARVPLSARTLRSNPRRVSPRPSAHSLLPPLHI